MRSTLALPLALLLSAWSSTCTVTAHAAPPNPDQLFALQQAAASAASVQARAQATSPLTSESSSREPAVRRHLRQTGRGHGMQRVKRGSIKAQAQREREMNRRGLDSSVVAAEGDDQSDLEARADQQYPLDAAGSSSSSSGSDNATAATTVSASASASASARKIQASAAASSAAPQQVTVNPDEYFTGVSSYYLYALADSERYQVLDAIKSGGFKVVRIFVAYVGANNKGSNNVEVNDLEPGAVGTYDDTVLYKIDQLMADCKDRGLKLLIALSDRYALGYWSTDAYALQLNIVKPGSSGVQRVADASAFYTNSWAAGAFDKRLQHALTHQNQLLGGRTWAELDDVVYAFEPQNEPQGHMQQASGTWACDRAAYLKSLIKSNILVGSGGGITIQESLGGWATTCASFDIVSVHDYGTSASTAVGAIQQAKGGAAKGKIVMMGEWGMTGANKASTISSFVSAFKNAGIPWMYWEVVKPGQAVSDFEVWTDEPSWGALTGGQFDSSPQYVPQTATTSKAAAAAPSSTKEAQWSSTKAPWSAPASSSSWSSQWQAPASQAADNNNDNNTWKPSPSSSPAAATTKASWTRTSAAAAPSQPPASQAQEKGEGPAASVASPKSRAVKTD